MARPSAVSNRGTLKRNRPLERDKLRWLQKDVSASSARHARLTSLQRSRVSTGRRAKIAKASGGARQRKEVQRGRGRVQRERA